MADVMRMAAQYEAMRADRSWNVPTHTRQRRSEGNPTAGDAFLEEIAPTFTVGWDGVGTTFYAFTADVSVLDGSFNSVDRVTG